MRLLEQSSSDHEFLVWGPNLLPTKAQTIDSPPVEAPRGRFGTRPGVGTGWLLLTLSTGFERAASADGHGLKS